MYKILLLICQCIFIIFSTSAQRAEDFKTVAEDGAWCWFSDPRAVYYKGIHERTYTGFVTSSGDIMVASEDHITGSEGKTLIYPKLQADDHVNPSLLILPDGRLMVFFTRHGGKVYYTTSEKPEEIGRFSNVDSLDLGKMACYTNPVLLRNENNRIYLFFRGGYDWKPSFVTSDDYGETWSEPKTIVSKKINNIYNRPYTKIVSDGKSVIHFAFTDGHPRDENYNSIYYLKYESGNFFDAAGEKMGDLGNLPIEQEKLPRAYDGETANQRAWIWDIAITGDGRPVIAYTTLPEETSHFYNWGIWTGKEWKNSRICKAGSAFPRFDRQKQDRDPEPHYSGGIVIDHNDPYRVYLSRPVNDRFEIEEWITADGGDSFSGRAVTSKSLKDNVRPVVVRNAPASLSPCVMWMHISHYEHYTNYSSAIKGNKAGGRFSTDLSSENIMKVMSAVADWQIDNFASVPHHQLDWTNGALYAGVMELAKISPDRKYMDWLYRIGRSHAWQPHRYIYHADDIAVCQMYLEMYRQKKTDRLSYLILAPTQARLDYVISHPSEAGLLLDYSDPQTTERWSWCDALFMAPPVYAKLSAITGDDKYLEFMDREYKATWNFLYDKDEHLFYRDHRYFPEKAMEANGRKVFWGRGNGWVMGGLVALLKELPDDNAYRPYYENLFTEMAEKVAECQDTEGFWHASMLDHESFPNPETSSSSFFCYSLAYGVNSGLLDKEIYTPVVNRAWKALVSAVHADGKLGWVQPIGENPKNVTSEMTEVYGVGAFLLAGSEMMILSQHNQLNDH